MRNRTYISILFVLLSLGIVAYAQQVETLDRVIATVNHTPVLQSEWEDSLRFEAFLQGRPPQSFSAEERLASLNRLVDRVLLLEQMQADYSPSREEVAARLHEIRNQLAGAESDVAWHSLLERYGMTEAGLRGAVENQMKILRFVDLRLRPSVRVTRDDIQKYYDETLVPQLKKAGVEPQPLEKLTPRIRELLAQQRMEGVLEDWLGNLRSQSEIHYDDLEPEATAPDSKSAPAKEPNN